MKCIILFVALVCGNLDVRGLNSFLDNGLNSPKLHDVMADAMKDDDEDHPIEAADGYDDSASALSEALGSRWNGKELEASADHATKAFLNGIGNKKAVEQMTMMLGALR